MYPEDWSSLYEIYFEATQKSHDYLILNFAQNTYERWRYRTNVFQDEYSSIVLAPVINEMDQNHLEKDKIELSRIERAKNSKHKVKKGHYLKQ